METKQCSYCKTIKPISKFSATKRLVDGLQGTCKECTYFQQKEYYKTKIGLAYKIFYCQISASKYRGHPKPLYTKDELYDWMISNRMFNGIYNNWVENGYLKKDRPSIDRINDYSGYSFDNIRLVTWNENLSKAHRDRRNGINLKRSTGVNQYTPEGKLINTFCSMSEAYRQTKVHFSHISKVCSGEMKKAGGFKWEYA